MSDGAQIALIGAISLTVGPLLLALLNDGLKARRERIAERTKVRERETAELMQAHRDALAAKDRECAAMTADRDWWRDRYMQVMDGWYGQRSSR